MFDCIIVRRGLTSTLIIVQCGLMWKSEITSTLYYARVIYSVQSIISFYILKGQNNNLKLFRGVNFNLWILWIYYHNTIIKPLKTKWQIKKFQILLLFIENNVNNCCHFHHIINRYKDIFLTICRIYVCVMQHFGNNNFFISLLELIFWKNI